MLSVVGRSMYMKEDYNWVELDIENRDLDRLFVATGNGQPTTNLARPGSWAPKGLRPTKPKIKQTTLNRRAQCT